MQHRQTRRGKSTRSEVGKPARTLYRIREHRQQCGPMIPAERWRLLHQISAQTLERIKQH